MWCEGMSANDSSGHCPTCTCVASSVTLYAPAFVRFVACHVREYPLRDGPRTVPPGRYSIALYEDGTSDLRPILAPESLRTERSPRT